MDNNIGHGDILQILLKNQKMNIATFARKHGIPPTTLYAIRDRNNRNTQPEVLRKISKALDVPLTIWDLTREELLLKKIFDNKDEHYSDNSGTMNPEVVKLIMEETNKTIEYIKYALDCIGYNNKYSIKNIESIINGEIPINHVLQADIEYILFHDKIIDHEELMHIENYRKLTSANKKIVNALIPQLLDAHEYEMQKEEEEWAKYNKTST